MASFDYVEICLVLYGVNKKTIRLIINKMKRESIKNNISDSLIFEKVLNDINLHELMIEELLLSYNKCKIFLSSNDAVKLYYTLKECGRA